MTTRVAILHYAAPPIIGGVESTIYHHARLLAGAGYGVTVITGRGAPFDERVAVEVIPELDSRYPEVLAVKAQLDAGQVSDDFHRLTEAVWQTLRRTLAGSDVCIVHNAITLHKNMPLTAALHRLTDESLTHFIAWHHDFAWLRPQYQNELHPGHPWDLLRQP